MIYIKKFENKFEENRLNHKKNFIDKSVQLHDGKYDYSKVDYITARKPVVIICPIHGDFQQRPYNHLLGKGCDKCAREINRKKLTKTKDNFIKDAINTHGDMYDYTDSIYINDSSKVNIKCPLHGEFIQIANHHLNGTGCPNCKLDRFIKINKEKHSKLFPEKASSIHNNFYDYSKVNYINAKTPVEVICPKHGSFFTKPSNHLSGRGCPVCVQSQGEKKIESCLIERKISFFRQKKFSDCKNKLPLSFDFWVESKNLLIEFDGVQHYKPFDYFGSEDKFEYTKKCDEIKNKYCLDNDINLLRIPYWDFKNIESILSNYLSQ